MKFRRKSFCYFLIIVAMVFLLYEWLTVLPTNNQPYEDPLFVKENVLCVLVPYRDRFEELQQFIPHMEKFLNSQNVDHRFIILNQTDSLRFNRASLINVGWFEADRLRCNYLVMHDVDLLPKNPALDYTFPGIGVVRHIAAGKYHPKKRDANLLQHLQRPDNLITGRGDTFLHIHDAKKRARDQVYTKLQKQMSHRRDRTSGLFSVNYKIADRQLLKIDGITASVINIELICDKTWTPYCALT
jgi:xylosylprotein 4-beta-galactosyltransferase